MAWPELASRVAARLYADAPPRRLFHGRGQCFAGLEHVSIDWLPPVIMVTLHADADEDFRAQLSRMLVDPARAAGARGLVLQFRQRRQAVTEVRWGEVPERLEVVEDGLRYLVRPLANQNTGLFLDVAPLRTWLRARVAGARVLNLFAYTCAFSVVAVAGGADQVVNLDMSRPALDVGRDNHVLNGHDPRTATYLPHNLFKSWWKLRQLGPYDWVIIDPPTWQRGSFNAERDYGSVLKRLDTLVKPGGNVLALLNSPFLPPRFLREQMARHCPRCTFEAWLPRALEFEDAFAERALKIGWFRYR